MGFFSKLKEKVFGKSNARSEKYVAALDKSRSNFSTKLNALAARYREINEDYFDELDEILIEADIGVKIVMEIIDETKKEVRLEKIKTPSEINETLVDKMFVYYAKGGEEMDTEIKMNEDGPTVILMVGVNGVGKTTSIAKIAYQLKNEGKMPKESIFVDFFENKYDNEGNKEVNKHKLVNDDTDDGLIDLTLLPANVTAGLTFELVANYGDIARIEY